MRGDRERLIVDIGERLQEAIDLLKRAANGDSDGTWMQEVRLWLDENVADWDNVTDFEEVVSRQGRVTLERKGQ